MSSGTQDWFYHAPTKKAERDPVSYPAPSQIPMIGVDMVAQDRDDDGMMKGVLKSYDTKYVRLAKMGGRKDLLTMRTPPPIPDDPKPYPRVDWFDHVPPEQPTDPSPRKVFLPDYMVHEEYDENTHEDALAGERPPPRRAPFSLQDKLSAFTRDGDTVTDKRMKLKEDVPRAKRFAKKDKKSDMAQLNKALSARRGNLAQKQKGKKIPQNEKDPVIFSKLLSMGYQHDWYNQREKYYDDMKKVDDQKPSYDRRDSLTKNNDMKTTEYREQINKKGDQIKNMHTPKRSDESRPCSDRMIHNCSISPNEDDMVNERFTNVSPKIDSRWKGTPPTKDTYLKQLAKVEV